MFRSAVLASLLAGCTVATPPPVPPPAGPPSVQRVPGEEVHRGLLQNQKSSPDSPSSDGRGSGDGRGR